MDVLCQLCSQVLCAGDSLQGSVMEGVAGGDPVPFLGHSQLVTFFYIKGHPNVLRSSCSWVELVGVLMTE